MLTFARCIKKFLAEETGPTAVEYAVMLALIIVVCVGSIAAVGGNSNGTYNAVGSALGGSGGDRGDGKGNNGNRGEGNNGNGNGNF